jgi:hypothetical protein
MGTQVSIIEVDLGTDIKNIIAEDVETLTGEAKKELEVAIATAKKRDELKEQKLTEKAKAGNVITEVLEEVYQKLASSENGMLCDEILDMIKDHVPNLSAFALRMKKILKDKENPYTLNRKKKSGQSYYYFKPFNIE